MIYYWRKNNIGLVCIMYLYPLPPSLSLSLARTARTCSISLQTWKRLSSFRGGSHGTVCTAGVVFNALNNGDLRSIIQLDKVRPSRALERIEYNKTRRIVESCDEYFTLVRVSARKFTTNYSHRMTRGVGFESPRCASVSIRERSGEEDIPVVKIENKRFGGGRIVCGEL